MPSQSSVLLQICDIFDPSEHQQFLAECWRLDHANTPSNETQFEGTREKIVSLVSHLVSVLKSKKLSFYLVCSGLLAWCPSYLDYLTYIHTFTTPTQPSPPIFLLSPRIIT